MIRLDVDGDELVVSLSFGDAVLACRRSLRIPLDHVEGVAVSARRLVPQTGLRLPGTSWPGVIRAGSYGTGDERDFWFVRRAQEVLVVQLLPGAEYRRIVLELPDPRADMLRLRPVLGPLAR